MNKDVKFTKNVYIILIAVLLLAVIIQIARSQYVLKFKHNSDLLEQRDVLLAAAKQEDKSVLSDDAPYCLVYSSDSDYSREVKGHAKRMLQYMQKPVAEFDLANENYDQIGRAHV